VAEIESFVSYKQKVGIGGAEKHRLDQGFDRSVTIDPSTNATVNNVWKMGAGEANFG
jgi:hypothetical protein